MSIRYDADFGVGILPKKLDVLNAEEFLKAEEIAYQNASKYDPEGFANGAYVDPKTKRTNPLLFDSNGNPLYADTVPSVVWGLFMERQMKLYR